MFFVAEIQTPESSSSLFKKAERVSAVMRILSHPQRLCLLCHLSQGPRTVGELAEMCSLSQPQVSQFLASLKEKGMIAAERNGRHIIYRLQDTRVLQVMHTISDLYCA